MPRVVFRIGVCVLIFSEKFANNAYTNPNNGGALEMIRRVAEKIATARSGMSSKVYRHPLLLRDFRR